MRSESEASKHSKRILDEGMKNTYQIEPGANIQREYKISTKYEKHIQTNGRKDTYFSYASLGSEQWRLARTIPKRWS
jgi:hypothetical protein